MKRICKDLLEMMTGQAVDRNAARDCCSAVWLMIISAIALIKRHVDAVRFRDVALSIFEIGTVHIGRSEAYHRKDNSYNSIWSLRFNVACITMQKPASFDLLSYYYTT